MMNCRQKKQKKQILIEKYGCLCYWCSKELPENELTLDHLNPISKGGSHSLENLRLACKYCNNKRGNSFYPPNWQGK